MTTIPLYTLQEGNIGVSLSLNYNAGSGVRVGDVAGWTGLGWSLNGIPTISRMVRGLPDEGKLDFDGTPRKGYFNSDVVNQSIDDDNESDFYFLNINGGSYRFMLRYMGGTGATIPSSDIKILPIVSNNPNDASGIVKVFSGFIITMPDGTIYTFGNGTEESAEVEVHDAQNNGIYPFGGNFLDFLHRNLVTSAWYATKISEPYGGTPPGHEINFTYDRFAYTFYKLSENEAGASCPSNVSKKINKVYVLGAEIATISGLNTKVVFNTNYKSCGIDETGQSVCTFQNIVRYDVDSWANTPTNSTNGAKMLLSMDVSDNVPNPTQVLSYFFNYDYLVAPNNSITDALPTGYTEANDVGTTHKKRLLLNRVLMPDGNTYNFTYAGFGSSDIRSRLTYGIDHWGYANGADGNITASGLLDIGACANSSNRASNASYSSQGSLIKISSSMGSETNFEYEPNRANNYGSGNIDIGGFRIKKIHNKDLLRNTEVIKEYNYQLSNGVSSGFLFIQPVYNFTDNNWGYMYRNSSLYSWMQSESGKPIVGYKQVTETVYDNGNTQATGKTISYFDQEETELSLAKSSLCYDIVTGTYIPCTINPPSSFNPTNDYRAGSLLKTEQYNQSNQLLSSTEMIYKPFSFINFGSFYGKKVIKFNGQLQSDASYYKAMYKYRIEHIITTNYSQDMLGSSTPQVSTTDLVYKDMMPYSYQALYKGRHNQVVKTTSRDSWGRLVESYNKYIADFNFDVDSTLVCEPDCVPCVESCKYWLITAHVPAEDTEAWGVYRLGSLIPAAPVESYTKRNGRIVSASYQSYLKDGVTGLALPKSNYSLRSIPTQTFSEVVFNKIGDVMLKDSRYGAARSTVLSYNAFGYPTQVKQTYGAVNEVVYDATNVLPLNKTQNYGIADAMTTSYEYALKYQGISKMLSPNGLEVRYNYRSSDNRLDTIKDKNGKILKQYNYIQTPTN